MAFLLSFSVYICVAQSVCRCVGEHSTSPQYSSYRVRDMACSDTFNIACCVGGMSYSWGSSKMGCLGNGDIRLCGTIFEGETTTFESTYDESISASCNSDRSVVVSVVEINRKFI